MTRLFLPALLAVFLCAAAPAPGQVLSATEEDPAERPDDPARDIQSLSSSYDPAAGEWTVAVRFYGVPSAETSALLRVTLGERARDGACQAPSHMPAMIAAYSDPADHGGKGMSDGQSVNLVKNVDADQRGFNLTFADAGLRNRTVCGIAQTSLSRKTPFDGVPAFEFPGAPAQPAPPEGEPAEADTTPPSAQMRVLRDPKSIRKGIVRVSVLAATEPLLARATLYGPGGAVQWRHGKHLAPGQMVQLRLRLRRRQLRRLERTGRLSVEVVTLLLDDAGNASHLREKVTLRYKRRPGG